ncbi:MAG: serine/threonine protein kinase [Acetobacteraceae bacterium]|nr:serine/threonine protein kinase [Acetobacteraceae bacterium]
MSSAIESLGKYSIRRQLGRGAMGTVYEGFDPVIERVVAIKTVRLPEVADEETAEEIARFRREAQAAGRLTHPNIVGVFDYGETADLAYIVMEYVDGPPLKNLLDKNERFPLPKIVQIMEDLLAGLQFSHERGVVHRDIKPANLMLTLSGQAKIADFGIARIESSSMTQAGTVLGTPAYMSPEQFMGLVVDARSDIYSSGVLLYQLLTGERPFEGSMSAIMHKALNTEAPSPSQISVTAPRPFDAVVKKAMAKRPEDRFASAAEFMAAIRAATMAPALAAGPEDDSGEATMISTPRMSAAARPDLSVASLAASIAPPPSARTGAVSAAAPAGGKSSTLPIIIGGGVAGLAVLGGLGWFLLAPGPTVTPPPVDSPPVSVLPVTPPPVSLPPVTPPPVSVPPVVSPPPVTPPPVVTVTPPPVTPPGPPVVLPPPVIPPVAIAPPPPVVAPPTPSPVETADAVRAELASYMSRQQCSLFDGDVRDGQVLVTGVGGKTAIDGIRQKIGTLVLPRPAPAPRVIVVDPVFCAWIDTLRPVAKGFGEPGARLALRLAGDPAWLVKDDYIRPRLTMGDFRGELHVDYIDRAGNVQHMYPQLGDPKEHMAADAPRMFDAGEQVTLGEPGPDNRGWQVDEPYGTDMIIAIMSEDALFDRPRTANVEKAVTYLRDLKKAVEAARARGARITATAMPLETRRK